ncbi:MAG: hypothetical protein KUG81_06340, partial [Gammaproteobacteria bacterium]|nr:hypothetical protein [Gammaproteobacteria bacterium]
MRKIIYILCVLVSFNCEAQSLSSLINQSGNNIVKVEEGEQGVEEITLNTSLTVYGTTPSLTKPTYLQTVTEPTFGTKITRISGDVGVAIPNVSPSENWLNVARHGYSTRQPWNADESIIPVSYTHLTLPT